MVFPEEPCDSRRTLLRWVISKVLDVLERRGLGLPDCSNRDGRQLNYNLRKRSVIDSHIGRNEVIVDIGMTAATLLGYDQTGLSYTVLVPKVSAGLPAVTRGIPW